MTDFFGRELNEDDFVLSPHQSELQIYRLVYSKEDNSWGKAWVEGYCVSDNSPSEFKHIVKLNSKNIVKITEAEVMLHVLQKD